MKFQSRRIFILFGLLAIILNSVTGCSYLFVNISTNNSTEFPQLDKTIDRYNGPMSKAYSFVHTTDKALALTFNGIGNDLIMKQLLDELDRFKIKATFFLPGMRVAEEPELAREIVDRGHEIENNTLNQLDMSELSYEQIYREIQLSNKVIHEKTGVSPRYVRTRSGDYSDDIRLAAAHLGMDAVISYSINPKDRDMKDAAEIGQYVKKYISRGAIINLNTDINPEIVSSIFYIAEAAQEVGYQFVTLQDLIERELEQLPLEQIAGHDAAQINLDYEHASYELLYKADPAKQRIALTLDDWGSDYTITKVLDILAEHDVAATFFVRAAGVEHNPNMARAIAEEGHEVANHTYSHPVVTTLTPQQLQEEVVKAHQIITEAIQRKPTMLFRPPTGEIDDRSARIIAAAGYSMIAMYDVTTLDWDTSNTADIILNNILDKTENGSVILLHILDDLHTIEALPQVIQQLKDKGFYFVTMSELFELDK